MICFSDGVYVDKPKRCLHCKWFLLWGCNGGNCCRNNKEEYKSANDHCKYFKRDIDIFYSDGRIKDKKKYDEMFM